MYNKLFVKFADDVTPFWDKAQFLVFVDSDPVSQATSDNARLNSSALQFAQQNREEYTRGYYTVRSLIEQTVSFNQNSIQVES